MVQVVHKTGGTDAWGWKNGEELDKRLMMALLLLSLLLLLLLLLLPPPRQRKSFKWHKKGIH
jgi:hypothetical protein